MPFDRYLDSQFPPHNPSNLYDDDLDAPPPSMPHSGLFDLHIPPLLTNPAGGPLGMQWLSQANLASPSSLSPPFQPALNREDSDNTPPSNEGNTPFNFPSPPSSSFSSTPANQLSLTQDAYVQQPNVTSSELVALKSSSAAIASFNAPSPLGLPVYSTTGFDLLPILARVAMRPNPKVSLGPVDLSCSFAIVNPRLHDHPIVYVSPQFCRLTGYSEAECVGRNCRFLQAPPGIEVTSGAHRQYTDNEAITHIKRSLSADKECQTSIVNYRKDGSAFINLITIIPITAGGEGEKSEEVVYQIGFQIDLTEQPNAILQRLQQGTYKADANKDVHVPQTQLMAQNRKSSLLPSTRMSKQLRALLSNRAFMDSLPISSSSLAHSPNPEVTPSSKDAGGESSAASNHVLSLLLLDYASDFVIVVSLKGYFLYVAPSIRRALGYEADELIGLSLSDICHPADTVPLTRELKDSSTVSHQPTPASSAAGNASSFTSSTGAGHPRPVDLLFRAKQKAGTYVWMECRGRLHIEPGKGRKAIILSGRVRPMEAIPWSVLAADSLAQSDGTEFWGLISTDPSARILSVGNGVGPVLGYNAADLLGKPLYDLGDGRGEMEAAVHAALNGTKENASTLFTTLRRANQSLVRVRLSIYRPTQRGGPSTSKPHSLIYHITLPEGAAQIVSSSSTLTRNAADDVFAELQAERTTSWQYELQQLRIENERLHAEMVSLETEVGESLTEEAHRRARGYSTSRPVVPLPSRPVAYPAMDTGGGGGTGGGGSTNYPYPVMDPSSATPTFAPMGQEWTSAPVPVFFQTPMHK